MENCPFRESIDASENSRSDSWFMSPANYTRYTIMVSYCIDLRLMSFSGCLYSCHLLLITFCYLCVQQLFLNLVICFINECNYFVITCIITIISGNGIITHNIHILNMYYNTECKLCVQTHSHCVIMKVASNRMLYQLAQYVCV